jgi:hypothetical protein
LSDIAITAILVLALGVGIVIGYLMAALRSQKRITELSTVLNTAQEKNDSM